MDSVQFQLNGRYVNPVTETIHEAIGNGWRQPKGNARCTNLVKVPLASRYMAVFGLYNYSLRATRLQPTEEELSGDYISRCNESVLSCHG